MAALWRLVGGGGEGGDSKCAISGNGDGRCSGALLEAEEKAATPNEEEEVSNCKC